jgi:hypothetical protein
MCVESDRPLATSHANGTTKAAEAIAAAAGGDIEVFFCLMGCMSFLDKGWVPARWL